MYILSDILNPTIWVADFEIREPITTLTDFMTALTCGFAYYLLNSEKRIVKDLSFTFFKLYFLCFFIGMTSAAFLGHAFQAYLPKEVKMIGWFMSAMGQLFLALGTMIFMKNLIKPFLFKLFFLLLLIQFSIFIFLMIHPTFSDFKIAQLAASSVLIGFIFPLFIIQFIKTKSKGSKLILFAIIYALFPALVFNNQLSISNWFNYHDISHVLMSIYMILMYNGIRKLEFKIA